MFNLIKKIREGRFTGVVYSFLVHRVLPSKIYIKYKFKKTYGFPLNLKDPKTFNEKIQYKKFFDRKSIYTTCADKFAVREYVKRKIGKQYLIPLLFSTTNPEEIDLSKLPNQFVIKSNHSSGHIIIVDDKNSIDINMIIGKCKKWLKVRLFPLYKEWHYKNIEPRILVEQFLRDENGHAPKDYKFHCFAGRVEFVFVDSDRFTDHKRTLFSRDWELLPFTFCPADSNNRPMFKPNKNESKPENFAEMIEVAESLSKDFDYVSVDFYTLQNKIFFGELTFTPGGGFMKFFPQEYDLIYGKKVHL